MVFLWVSPVSLGCSTCRPLQTFHWVSSSRAHVSLPFATAIGEGYGFCEDVSILPAVSQVGRTPTRVVLHGVVTGTGLCHRGKGTIKAVGPRNENLQSVCSGTAFSEHSLWQVLFGLQTNLMLFFVSVFLTFYLVPGFYVFMEQNKTVLF